MVVVSSSSGNEVKFTSSVSGCEKLPNDPVKPGCFPSLGPQFASSGSVPSNGKVRKCLV